MTRRRTWTRDPATLAVAALAAHRVTRLLTTDAFPPTEAARTALEDALPARWQHGPSCPWCVGFWVACGTVAAAEAAHRAGRGREFRLAALPWAISSVVGFLADRELG